MAVNLIGRECYMCINHPDKYPLAFILCFAFSTQWICWFLVCLLIFLNKCALYLELERPYSINLALSFSLIFIYQPRFSRFPHLHDKDMIRSLHLHARRLGLIYLPAVQFLKLALRLSAGLFCFCIGKF